MAGIMLIEYFREYYLQDTGASNIPGFVVKFEEYCKQHHIRLCDAHNYIDEMMSEHILSQFSRSNYRRTLRNLLVFVCKKKKVEQLRDRVNETYILNFDGNYKKV